MSSGNFCFYFNVLILFPEILFLLEKELLLQHERVYYGQTPYTEGRKMVHQKQSALIPPKKKQTWLSYFKKALHKDII